MSGEAHSSENGGRSAFSSPHEKLLGENPRIREINALVRRVAPTSLTVFLTGETGTGKDIVAALIHRLHSRAKRPFVKVNCPSIPEAILESELFGHDRGAFTGAHTSRPGRLELAAHGTLFLDEICSISLRCQSKLIPVLDGEPFMRVGGTELIPMQARIIAAANIGVDLAVAQGRLHTDIASRLKEMFIHLPPLRERQDDIALLAEHFNYHACKTLGREYHQLEAQVVELLKQMYWQGNVRQLAGWVREFVAMGSRSVVLSEAPTELEFPHRIETRVGRNGPASPKEERAERRFMPLSEAGKLAAEKAERELIEDTLRYTLWNRREAAELLETSYSSLLRRIGKYGIGRS